MKSSFSLLGRGSLRKKHGVGRVRADHELWFSHRVVIERRKRLKSLIRLFSLRKHEWLYLRRQKGKVRKGGFRWDFKAMRYRPLWYKIKGGEFDRDLSDNELYRRGMQSLDMWRLNLASSRVTAFKNVARWKKRLSEEEGGRLRYMPHYVAVDKSRDYIVTRLTKLGSRIDMLNEHIDYVDRVIEGKGNKQFVIKGVDFKKIESELSSLGGEEPKIGDKDLLTVMDPHKFWEPKKHIRICGFYDNKESAMNMGVRRLGRTGHGYSTDEFMKDNKIYTADVYKRTFNEKKLLLDTKTENKIYVGRHGTLVREGFFEKDS